VAWRKRKSAFSHGPSKKHNGVLGVDAKVEIRRNVLAALGPGNASVFDAFCGPVGEMHAAVWAGAARYVGVDKEWEKQDARRRFVAEAATVLRAIDLRQFNVFDLDSFGSPWAEAIILAARRRWSPGERGAIVLTDGSDGKLKYGQTMRALHELIGPAHHKSLREQQQRAAIAAWAARAGVVIEQAWLARGYSGQAGSLVMQYVGVMFRGAGELSDRASWN
jgi:hypothetical protein